MEKTLFLDAGNTRVKAAVLETGLPVPGQGGRAEYPAVSDDSQQDGSTPGPDGRRKLVAVSQEWTVLLLPGYDDPDFESVLRQAAMPCARVVLSSVKKRFQSNELASILSGGDLPSPPEILAVTRSVLTPERHRYRTPETLGIDRYLACLGAWSLTSGAVIVSDAGTACTIDAMDSGGVYRGGVIMPGLHMLIETLGHGADGLFTVPPGLPENWPPDTTTAALQAGTTGTFLAAWQAHVQRMHQLYPDARIFLTGGDAAFLAKKTSIETYRSDLLVFEGMRYWLEVMRGSSQK
jgi:pantothenate kinase type III